jgi:uncharacterized membrane protein (DUF485 family)
VAESGRSLDSVARSHRRVVTALTVAIVAIYFGFVFLIAFAKPLLATLLVRGLTLGILLGALVIVLSWLLTLVYVRWANRHHDAAVDGLRR